MILRKPYAILIKNFKLIHVLISLAMAFLTYKTFLIFDYLSKFNKANMLSGKRGIAEELITNLNYILPFIIIGLLSIILVIMIHKKKPMVFYIVGIVVYAITLVCYGHLYTVLTEIGTIIIDNRTARAALDITTMLLLSQFITLILTAVRATGFNIKQFNFEKDLKELEIEEADSEEFEININIEGNLVKRAINRNLRYAKYVYKENQLLILGIVMASILALAFIIYLNLDLNQIIYNQGDIFNVNDLELGVTNSLVTKKDYKGKEVTGNKLVIIELNVKASSEGKRINSARTELILNGISFYPVDKKYSKSLIDLGTSYSKEVLATKFTKLLLVYEIPNSFKTSNVKFRYTDDIEIIKNKIKPKYITVNIKPFDLDIKVDLAKEIEKDSTILNSNTLGDTKVKINSIDLKEQFESKYTFCVSKDECIPSIEYIKPNLNTNYDKGLIKLDAIFKKNDELNFPQLLNVFTLLNIYGTLEYKIEDKVYSISKFTRVYPQKLKSDNIYYLEIPKDVLKSSNAYINLNIRNKIYKIILK